MKKRRACVATAMLLAVLAAGATSAAAQQAGADEQMGSGVRIVAQRLTDGRIEVALQQRSTDDQWGERLLPARRFIPAEVRVGRWLAGSPLTISRPATETSAAEIEMRIVAQRLTDGRTEVALQQHSTDDQWGERLLPARRFIPAEVRVGRWLASSPVNEPEPLPTATEADPPPTATDADPSPTATDADPPPTTSTTTPPQEVGADDPKALMTPTGVPVVVLGRAGSGYLVRTPCGSTAEIAGGTPIEPVQVVLDPGHGGVWESGAVGPNGLAEHDLNLTLSRAILGELTARGISAATTRTGDYGMWLSVRAAFADALEADALISIHHNAPTPRLGDTPGAEVFIQSLPDGTPRASSARLGGLLYEEITKALATFEGISWGRLRRAGVLRVLLPDGGDAYGMIRRPVTPAALVEFGYISNRSEAELFATDEYISVASKAAADAIDAYLNTDRPGTGFVNTPRVFDPARAPIRCVEVALE